MQEVDDKKLSDLSKRFLQAISYCGLSGYKLKKDNIISSESTLTSIKKGIQLPSKKTIDAFCEKYDVSRAWLYTGEGLFAKTPSGQIEPSEKDIRDALKNARMQSDSTISKVAPYLQDILVYVILDIRLKTEENYFIVLLSPAMEILKKYDYVLPIISNQQYNLRLKIVADYAGLDRNLTVHMSRHTFATMCLNNGVKMENVSKMLGHTNVRTTQQYAKVLNAEVEKDFEMLERILS